MKVVTAPSPRCGTLEAARAGSSVKCRSRYRSCAGHRRLPRPSLSSAGTPVPLGVPRRAAHGCRGRFPCCRLRSLQRRARRLGERDARRHVLQGRGRHAAGQRVGVGVEVADREVVVLWASQTGNAEELAACGGRAAHCRAVIGRGSSAWTTAAVTALARSADLLVDHQHLRRRRRTRQRLRLLGLALRRAGTHGWTACATRSWRSATPRTTTSAGTDADWTQRLDELGAVRLAPRTDCEPDFEPSADAWLDQVLDVLDTSDTKFTGNEPAQKPGYSQEQPAGSPATAASAPVSPPPPCRRGPPSPRRRPPGSSATGCSACPARPRRCAGSPSTPSGTALTYEAGDALGVRPVNCPVPRRRNGWP